MRGAVKVKIITPSPCESLHPKQAGDGHHVIGGDRAQLQLPGVHEVDKLDEAVTGHKVQVDCHQTLQYIIICKRTLC